ncbi:hypothetical protein EDB87DRAFT_1764260 [Lactarius vividus]|nr:hypothetical protein EDB87DRAFT_1764260 [Lactarius vividus]
MSIWIPPMLFIRLSCRIARENDAGLGWWNLEDKQHPDNRVLPDLIAPNRIDSPVAEPVEDDDEPTAGASASLNLTLENAPVDAPDFWTLAAAITSAPGSPVAPAILASTIAPTMSAAPAATAPSGVKLSGNAPVIFDGGRDNPENSCASLTCTVNVDDWVDTQLEELQTKVTGTATTSAIPKTNESLWNDFVREFKQAYTHVTEKQDAYQLLKALRMNLAAKASYALDATATVDLYSAGLQKGLLSAILKRDTVPETFTQWVEAAQKEQRKYVMLHARVVLNDSKKIGGKTKNEWFQLLNSAGNNSGGRRTSGNGQQTTTPIRDPDAMDVDRIVLTNEELQRCHSEGRCFRYFGKGHLSHDCPKRSGSNSGNVTTSRQNDNRHTNNATSARVAEITPTTEAPPTPNARTKTNTSKPNNPTPTKNADRGTLAKIRAMKNEEKEALLDTLFTDEDF